MSLLQDSVPEVLVPWRSCGISFLHPDARWLLNFCLHDTLLLSTVKVFGLRYLAVTRLLLSYVPMTRYMKIFSSEDDIDFYIVMESIYIINFLIVAIVQRTSVIILHEFLFSFVFILFTSNP